MSLKEEIDNIMNKDPAARSALEVVLCYPGFHALIIYRIANWFWLKRFYTFARLISHIGRIQTGIEIHPGAQIGKRVFIDHGMGVVVGETTIIGDDVVIYQGVTLGAGSDARGGFKTRGKKRHPTLGKGVIVGSGAEIQGPVIIGDNVQVASGSIVLKDVPENSIVVGVPGRVIYQDGKRVDGPVPDIEAQAIKALKDQMTELSHKINALMAATGVSEVQVNQSSKNKENSEMTIDEQSILNDPVDVFLHGAGI
jgi:serine O-acetyltransferase